MPLSFCLRSLWPAGEHQGQLSPKMPRKFLGEKCSERHLNLATTWEFCRGRPKQGYRWDSGWKGQRKITRSPEVLKGEKGGGVSGGECLGVLLFWAIAQLTVSQAEKYIHKL